MCGAYTDGGWQLHADWSAVTLFAHNKIPEVMEQYVVMTAQMDSQHFVQSSGWVDNNYKHLIGFFSFQAKDQYPMCFFLFFRKLLVHSSLICLQRMFEPFPIDTLKKGCFS